MDTVNTTSDEGGKHCTHRVKRRNGQRATDNSTIITIHVAMANGQQYKLRNVDDILVNVVNARHTNGT